MQVADIANYLKESHGEHVEILDDMIMLAVDIDEYTLYVYLTLTEYCGSIGVCIQMYIGGPDGEFIDWSRCEGAYRESLFELQRAMRFSRLQLEWSKNDTLLLELYRQDIAPGAVEDEDEPEEITESGVMVVSGTDKDTAMFCQDVIDAMLRDMEEIAPFLGTILKGCPVTADMVEAALDATLEPVRH